MAIPMRTESNKSYKFGFVLTEAELRRLLGILEDQLKKIPGVSLVTTKFEVKYRNGAVATTSSLDEILSQENLGSSQIVELKIESTTESDQAPNLISVEFHDLNLDPKSDDSVRFTVKGDERAWTFITSSLLEERALRIKRFNLGMLLGIRREWELILYMVAVMFGLMGWLTFEILDPLDFPRVESVYIADSELPKRATLSETLDARLKSENVKDPIQALILREKLIEEREKDREKAFESLAAVRNSTAASNRVSNWRDTWRRHFILTLLVVGLVPPSLLYCARLLVIMYYPTFNFAWGDYLEIFRRKESVRKFIVVVILVGVIVSFIGGVLANISRIGQ
ncbi:MAG TPA: hypothetical protein VGN10_17635 [Pyrinomonadaceae bacterium]